MNFLPVKYHFVILRFNSTYNWQACLRIRMKKRKTILYKIPLKIGGYLLAFVLLAVVVSNLVIIFSSYRSLYDDVAEIPPQKTAIVLGTSHFLKSGNPNPYFHYRLSAAAELYHTGKVQYFILSGDNREQNYNEPEQMRRQMVRYGVPDSVLYLDYAGLRTLDSMVRSREVFGQDSIIVVSQKFHNQRAIFLARAKNINAIGYNATDLDKRQGIRTHFREVFARVKVFFDLATRKQPRHLGEKVIIGEGQERYKRSDSN